MEQEHKTTTVGKDVGSNVKVAKIDLPGAIAVGQEQSILEGIRHIADDYERDGKDFEIWIRFNATRTVALLTRVTKAEIDEATVIMSEIGRRNALEAAIAVNVGQALATGGTLRALTLLVPTPDRDAPVYIDPVPPNDYKELARTVIRLILSSERDNTGYFVYAYQMRDKDTTFAPVFVGTPLLRREVISGSMGVARLAEEMRAALDRAGEEGRTFRA
jgi:hypothetical protein